MTITPDSTPAEDALSLVRLRGNGGSPYGRALDQVLAKYGSGAEFQIQLGPSQTATQVQAVLGDVLSRQNTSEGQKFAEAFPFRVQGDRTGVPGGLEDVREIPGTLAAIPGQIAGAVGDAATLTRDRIQGQAPPINISPSPPQLSPEQTGFERTLEQVGSAFDPRQLLTPFKLGMEAFGDLSQASAGLGGQVEQGVRDFFGTPIGEMEQRAAAERVLGPEPFLGAPLDPNQQPGLPPVPAVAPPAAPLLGAGTQLDLGPVPQFPAPPQMEMPEAPDFDPIRALMEEARPQGLSEEEAFDRNLVNILGGLAAGMLSVPQAASVGRLLLGAGAGALSGVQRGRAEDAEFDKRLQKFKLSQAEAELAFQSADRQFALDKAKTAFQNQMAVYEHKVKEFEAQQGEFLGFNQGFLTYSVVEDGRRVVKVKDTGVFQQMLDAKLELARATGADPIVVDLLSTERELDPNDPLDAAFGFIIKLEKRGLLNAVFSAEDIEAAVDIASQQIDNIGPVGDAQFIAAQTNNARLAALAARIATSPELQARATQVLSGFQ
jgi:hypothetical protein